jgi:hypothetical protein
MNPTGEAESGVLRLDFDRRIMVQFRGSVVTSDAGLLAYRELDDAFGLTSATGDLLADVRTGQNGRHALVGMFRQSIFGRLAGYEDVNDALRLRHDPAMRWIIGDKATTRSGASPSQMGRFETTWLAKPENLVTLADLSGHWIDQVAKRRSDKRVVLDMDSSVSPTHGEQEGSVWNGHFVCTCYHPLFVFNQYGDLERCALRHGNVHSADGWEAVLKPVVARYRKAAARIAFRGDAAFAQPNIYEFLEAEGIEYAIRLPANQILQARIGHLLKRPVGRPAHYVQRIYKSFRYQAASWRVLVGLSPRWNGTSGNCSRASGSSSRTCGSNRRTSLGSTTSAGRANNGSRRARQRSSGRAYRAARSTPTRSASSFTRWLTISRTSFVPW